MLVLMMVIVEFGLVNFFVCVVVLMFSVNLEMMVMFVWLSFFENCFVCCMFWVVVLWLLIIVSVLFVSSVGLLCMYSSKGGLVICSKFGG